MRDPSSFTLLFPFFSNARPVVLAGRVVHGSPISVRPKTRTCSSLYVFVVVAQRYVYSADAGYAMLVYCVVRIASADDDLLLKELYKHWGGVWPETAFDKMACHTSNQGNTERFHWNASASEMGEVCTHGRRPTQLCMLHDGDRVRQYLNPNGWRGLIVTLKSHTSSSYRSGRACSPICLAVQTVLCAQSGDRVRRILHTSKTRLAISYGPCACHPT